MSGRAPAGADRFAPTAVTVVLVVAMLAAAMIPWWPIYESPAFFLAAARRSSSARPSAWSARGVDGPPGASSSPWSRRTSWSAYPSRCPTSRCSGFLPTPAGMVELVAGAALSWKQLVTIAVPVGSYQALLVPPFLLGLICATLAVTIALRSRYPATAALPPAVLFVTGIALGVVHVGIALQAGLIFLVAVVGWLVRVAIAKRRAITRVRRAEGAVADARRVLGASVLIAVSLIGATAASIAMPGPHRSVVRAELQPPFEPHEHDSPLAGFRTAFREEVADRVMLEVSGLPPGAGIRIAALDTYDGVVYSVGGSDGNTLSGRFARVPYQLDQTDAVGTSEDIAVEVADYDEVWVPGIGQLERITFGGDAAVARTDAYYYNDVTGTGATQNGLEKGDRYVARSKVPAPAARSRRTGARNERAAGDARAARRARAAARAVGARLGRAGPSALAAHRGVRARGLCQSWARRRAAESIGALARPTRRARHREADAGRRRAVRRRRGAHGPAHRFPRPRRRRLPGAARDADR